eukprot:Rmarinus@m.25033
MYVDPEEPYSCTPCPDSLMTVDNTGTCVCPTDYTLVSNAYQLQDTCYSESHMLLTDTVVDDMLYDVGGTTVTVDSVPMNELFPGSVLSCKYDKEFRACQAIGNMCTLQHYDQDKAACDFIRNPPCDPDNMVHNIEDWREGFPWLYYDEYSVEQVVDSESITMQVAFDAATDRVDTLTYYLVGYSFNGTYLGVEELDHQLQFCWGTGSGYLDWLRFGHVYDSSCTIDLFTDVAYADETVFYDVYVLDAGNTGYEYYPVPIRVKNILENGKSVNTDGTADNDVFVRRFYLYDNVSGMRSNPKYVTYAKTVEISVTNRASSRERIFPPVITVEYAAARLDEDLGSSSVETSVSFSAGYYSDMSDFLGTLEGLFIAAMVLAGLTWMYKLFSFMRVRQHQNMDATFLLRMILYACEVVSSALFWLLFIGCGYFFVTFKGQSTVHTLLPSDSDKSDFVVLLWCAFVFKLIHVGDIIYRQTSCDIFLIDWEKSHGQLFPTKESAPVSIWRTLFIANEWNEIQTLRYVNIELALFMLLFFLRGLNLEYLATRQPVASDLDEGETEDVLRFAVAMFFWLAVALAQWLFKKLFYHRYVKNQAIQFADLLSVANISILILEDQYYGYYLHGQSVHPHADTTLLNLNEYLKQEEQNMCKLRGMRDDDENQMTSFEIYISPEIRRLLDDKFLILRKKELESQVSRKGSGAGQQKTQQEASQSLIEAHHKLTKFLATFIEQAQTNQRKNILDRTFLQQILSLPPDTTEFSETLFYNDPQYSFTRLLYLGVEMDILMFDMLLYALVDYGTANTFVAIVVTYIGDRILSFIREYFGEENLSRKTLVSDQFLL